MHHRRLRGLPTTSASVSDSLLQQFGFGTRVLVSVSGECESFRRQASQTGP